MRRFLIVAAMVMAVLAVWASGAPETGTITLTVLANNDGGSAVFEPLWAERMAPQKVATRWITINIGDGTTISMDMLTAAGAYPNIYSDFTGRASRYMVRTAGWKAMDLAPYVNKDDYYDIQPWIRDGRLLGIPHQVPLQGIGINLDLLKEAGVAAPKADWTIDEFLEMCKAVAKLPGKYGTALFAKSASADYLWMNWFGSFGAKVFTNGDYTRTSINSPEGLATVRFLGALVQNGYAPKDSADLWDDAALELWQKGLVAAMPIRPDWIEMYMTAAVDQKMIPKAFDYTFVPFPRGPVVKATPTLGAGSTTVVYESGNVAMDHAAGVLAAYMGGKEYQQHCAENIALWGGWPTLKTVRQIPKIEGKALEMWKTTNTIKETGGVMDVGYTLPGYSAIRAELFPRLAAMYMGKETPEEVLAKYEAKVNEILKK